LFSKRIQIQTAADALWEFLILKPEEKSVIFIDEKTKPGMAEILSEAAKRNGASV